jgi:hypothetical protein
MHDFRSTPAVVNRSRRGLRVGSRAVEQVEQDELRK